MFPYYYRPAVPSDSEYLRALAEERAAREQFAAARRAQEEARERAARARAARRAYGLPYSSYHNDNYNLTDPFDYDMDLGLNDGGAYYSRPRPMSYAGPSRPYTYDTPSYGYGLDPYQQRVFLEEQRKKELLEEQKRRELLELEREKEHRRQEEERIRRILQEERQREEAARQKMLEQEQLRRAMEEEKLSRAMEEERIRRTLHQEEETRRERDRGHLRSQSQQASLEPLLRALGFVPAASGESESEKERPRGRASQGPRRNAAPSSPSPIRPYSFGRSAQRPDGTPAVNKASTTTPTYTTIPITSHVKPTEEQIAAAEKIQDAYRAYFTRKEALKAVASLRKRFLTARNGFTLPSSLDYDMLTNGHIPTSISISPKVAHDLSSSSIDAEDPLQNVPKLVYTPTNAPLHAYEEELNRILSVLDAVESHGDKGVRAARRELARAVEHEAERVERWGAIVWNWWTQREAEKRNAAKLAQPAEQANSTENEPAPDITISESAPLEVLPEPASKPIPTRVDVLTSQAPQVDTPAAQSPIHVPTPAVSVEAAESPAPEVEIPDADAVEAQLALPQIVVEPPSRAEPKSYEPKLVDALALYPEPQSFSVPITEAVDIPTVPSAVAAEPESPTEADFAPERPATPALSHEGEMEVEPEEAMTPPPSAPSPLVAVEPTVEGAVAKEVEDQSQMRQNEEHQAMSKQQSSVIDEQNEREHEINF